MGVVAFAISSGAPDAVVNARRVTPPTVLKLELGEVPLVELEAALYGSNARDRNWVTTAWLPAAAVSRPGGRASKLDGDPGALMGATDTTPGGVTEMAA